jgi:hypothetical protein
MARLHHIHAVSRCGRRKALPCISVEARRVVETA